MLLTVGVYVCCWSAMYKCSDGTPLTPARRCNGLVECSDAADEQNCSQLSFLLTYLMLSYVVTAGLDVIIAVMMCYLQHAVAGSSAVEVGRALLSVSDVMAHSTVRTCLMNATVHATQVD